jgi:LCP family protein required for cell wall assembly
VINRHRRHEPPITPSRRSRLRRLLLGGVAVLSVLCIGAVTVTAIAAQRLRGNIRTQDIRPLLGADRPTPAANAASGVRGPVDVLVLGSDSRAGADHFVGGVDNGARSDTAILLHLSADRTRAVAVSIPRDSMVAIPDCTTASGGTARASVRMFNDAFTTGGAACAVKTVESLTHVRVDHYVVIDFAGFKNIVDALGTVPICLPQPVNDPRHGIRLPAGRSSVDGTTALAYVRERYVLGDGSDLGRIRRQQAFLSSVLQQATGTGDLTDPPRLYGVLDAATRSLTMDPQLAGLSTLAGFSTDLARIGLAHIRFLTVPTAVDPADRNRLVWTSPATTLWTALRDDAPIPSPATPTTATSSTTSPTTTGRTAATSICSA